jgi:hypothetical protein
VSPQTRLSSAIKLLPPFRSPYSTDIDLDSQYRNHFTIRMANDRVTTKRAFCLNARRIVIIVSLYYTTAIYPAATAAKTCKLGQICGSIQRQATGEKEIRCLSRVPCKHQSNYCGSMLCRTVATQWTQKITLLYYSSASILQPGCLYIVQSKTSEPCCCYQ